MDQVPEKISSDALKKLSIGAAPGITPMKGKEFKDYCIDQIMMLEALLEDMETVLSDNIIPTRWEKYEAAKIKLSKAISLLKSSIKI